MHSSTSGQPHGKSLVTSPLPDGGVYQRANLVHQFQEHSDQPSSLHTAYSLCRQPAHFRRQPSQGSRSIRRIVGRRLLWKTDHSGNRTWPRVSWFHAWNHASWTHLLWSHQHFTGPLSILGFSTQSAIKWLPFSTPHRHQRSLPRISGSTRFGSIDRPLHAGWLFSWRTSSPLISIAQKKTIAALIVLLFVTATLSPVLGLLSAFLSFLIGCCVSGLSSYFF